MSVAKIFDRVVGLESRLGLENDGEQYSERVLALLYALEISLEDEIDCTPPELDAGAFEQNLSRLQDMVNHKDLNVSELPGGETMEDIMARIKNQMTTDE
jgi:hypothetical protein